MNDLSLPLLQILCSCFYMIVVAVAGVAGFVWTLVRWAIVKRTVWESILFHLPVLGLLILIGAGYGMSLDWRGQDQKLTFVLISVGVSHGLFFAAGLVSFAAGADLWRMAGVEPFHSLARPGLRRWLTPYGKDSLASIAALLVLTGGLFLSGLATTRDEFADIARALSSSPVGGLGFVLSAAVIEEVLMRLVVQGAIYRLCVRFDPAGWISIGVTALIWAAGHVGEVDPEWIKILQMLVWGVLQGWLMRWRGFETCVAVHLGANAVLVVVTA